MGSSRFYRDLTKAEIAEQKRFVRAQKKEEDLKRRKFAEKVVSVVVDKINFEIVRPGPKPEERECYVMAQELRDFSPALIKLVADIIKVREEEGD